MAVLIITPYQQFFDSNGDPLNGGKVYTYDAGTLTPKATYSDNTESTPLANPVILDSAGRAVIWGTGTYKFIVKDSLDNTIQTTDNVAMYSASSGSVIPSANAAGTVDAITADYNPNITLTDKVLVAISSAGANTSTTPTFAPDGNTARTIVKFGSTALVAGDIGAAGSVHLLQYDLTNTRWQLLNPATSFSYNTNIAPFQKDKLLVGMTLTNAADTVNDVTIAAGSCVSDDSSPVVMTLGSAITKQLDAAWAVGTNAGGLDTGSVANATYYIWVINRPDTNVTDVLFSTSSTAPTLPTNYTKKFFLGGFNRVAGTIVNNEFNYNGRFVSANRTVTTNTTTTVAHCLGAIPDRYKVDVVCTTAQGLFAIGDRFPLGTFNNGAGNFVNGPVWTNLTNIVGRVSVNGLYNEGALTDANFRLVFTAERIR